MKIKAEHIAHMKAAIEAIWTPEKHNAHRQFIINEGKAKDAEKRLRWDWAYYARLSAFICDEVYSYGCNDNHVDTALRHIIAQIENEQSVAA